MENQSSVTSVLLLVWLQTCWNLKCRIFSEPNVGRHHFLQVCTVMTIVCPWIYGLLLECWLLFQKFEESQQNLKWTVALSTENKRHTCIYLYRVQSCKQIPSSRAVQIVWHLMGGKGLKTGTVPLLRHWIWLQKNTDLTPSLRLGSDFSVQNQYTVLKVINQSILSRTGRFDCLCPHSWIPCGLQVKLFCSNCLATASSHAKENNGSNWAASMYPNCVTERNNMSNE